MAAMSHDADGPPPLQSPGPLFSSYDQRVGELPASWTLNNVGVTAADALCMRGTATVGIMSATDSAQGQLQEL